MISNPPESSPQEAPETRRVPPRPFCPYFSVPHSGTYPQSSLKDPPFFSCSLRAATRPPSFPQTPCPGTDGEPCIYNPPPPPPQPASTAHSPATALTSQHPPSFQWPTHLFSPPGDLTQILLQPQAPSVSNAPQRHRTLQKTVPAIPRRPPPSSPPPDYREGRRG